jgi:hypothetical protein
MNVDVFFVCDVFFVLSASSPLLVIGLQSSCLYRRVFLFLIAFFMFLTLSFFQKILKLIFLFHLLQVEGCLQQHVYQHTQY